MVGREIVDPLALWLGAIMGVCDERGREMARVGAIAARVSELTTLRVRAHWTPFEDDGLAPGRWDLRTHRHTVSSTRLADEAAPVEEVAQDIARAFWMAALADQGAPSSRGGC